MFIYVYADIKTLFQPEIPEQIISGVMGGMTINQSFLFAAAILMSIPPIMILLSLILKPSINRWVNIIVSFLHIFTYNSHTFCARQNMVLLYLLSINRSNFSFANYLVRLEMANTRKRIESASLNTSDNSEILD